MDPAVFGYEWRRLATDEPTSHELLQVLARFAPDQPISLAWFRDAGDGLARGVAEICGTPGTLRAMLSRLRDRGLLELDRDAALVRAEIHDHIVAQSTASEHAHWIAEVLVFLTHALRADTHHSSAWPEWSAAYPHVLYLCAAAELERARLGDVVYLLDRASVYMREGSQDARQATALAERAVKLSEELGKDDPTLHADCLGNLALAYYAAGRMQKAAKSSGDSIRHLAATVGVETVDYAESLNVHANILGAWGRRDAAEQAHEEALTIIRSVHATNPTPEVTMVLGEILNDYAAALLTGPPMRRRAQTDRTAKGRALLQEASNLVRRGDYGWTQIEQNLARASRAQGEAEEARTRLESLRDYCLANDLNPSLTLYATLRDLAEVQDELGDLRAAAETLRQAHRVDNALATSLHRPLDHGRTS
jgi:tetratricopeptide (TPR) repeat protein